MLLVVTNKILPPANVDSCVESSFLLPLQEFSFILLYQADFFHFVLLWFVTLKKLENLHSILYDKFLNQAHTTEKHTTHNLYPIQTKMMIFFLSHTLSGVRGFNMVFVFALFLDLPSFSFFSFFVSLFVFFFLACLLVCLKNDQTCSLFVICNCYDNRTFFLFGFSFTNIHDSQDIRGRERLFP